MPRFRDPAGSLSELGGLGALEELNLCFCHLTGERLDDITVVLSPLKWR